MTNKKKLILKTRAEVDFARKFLKAEVFNEKFIVSMKVVSEELAEQALVNDYFDDSRMALPEEISDLSRNGLVDPRKFISSVIFEN